MKKIIFILHNYNFISERTNKEKLTIKEIYKYLRINNAVWPNFFGKNLKKNFISKIEYPYILKKHYGKKKYIEKFEERVNKFSPDIIFNFTNDQTVHNMLAKYKKNIKNIIWLSFKINANEIKNLKKSYDFLISDNNNIIKLSSKIGLKSFKLLSSTPNYNKISKKNFLYRENTPYFSGSLGGHFSERSNILEFLSYKINIKTRIRNLSERYKIINFLNNKLIYYFPRFSDYLYSKRILPITNNLKHSNDRMVFGNDMHNDMKKYKYCINIHSDFDKNNSTNIRTYEVLSNGCLLFTDYNTDTQKKFFDKKHVIYFKSKEDLLKKIIYYQKRNDLAFKIAKAGNNLFKSKYHSQKRLTNFYLILKQIIKD